jgi:hypothetical protein
LDRSVSVGESRSGFCTLKLEDPIAPRSLNVHAPKGLRIEGIDIPALEDLIRALETESW